MELKKYNVDWWEAHSTEVEAEDEDDAFNKAMEKSGQTNTCIDIPDEKAIIEEIK